MRTLIKKKMLKVGLIHNVSDKQFMKIIFEEMKLISSKDYERFVVEGKLSSKAFSVQRENNFNNIFEGLF